MVLMVCVVVRIVGCWYNVLLVLCGGCIVLCSVVVYYVVCVMCLVWVGDVDVLFFIVFVVVVYLVGLMV